MDYPSALSRLHRLVLSDSFKYIAKMKAKIHQTCIALFLCIKYLYAPFWFITKIAILVRYRFNAVFSYFSLAQFLLILQLRIFVLSQ